MFAVRSFRSMEGLQRLLDVKSDWPEFDCDRCWISISLDARTRRRGIGKSILSEGPKAVLGESGRGLAGRFSVALSTGNSAFCVVVALAACLAQPAFALDPRYPDWPCQQLKVPGISIASVWTGPSIEGLDKNESYEGF